MTQIEFETAAPTGARTRLVVTANVDKYSLCRSVWKPGGAGFHRDDHGRILEGRGKVALP